MGKRKEQMHGGLMKKQVQQSSPEREGSDLFAGKKVQESEPTRKLLQGTERERPRPQGTGPGLDLGQDTGPSSFWPEGRYADGKDGNTFAGGGH